MPTQSLKPRLQGAQSQPRDQKDKYLVGERVQLGVRLEKRLVKVLKAMAEYADVSLTELLETIVLNSFEGGKTPTFSGQQLQVLADFKRVYRLDYSTQTSQSFAEKSEGRAEKGQES